MTRPMDTHRNIQSTPPSSDIDFMLNSLTMEELEIAARTNYKYVKNHHQNTKRSYAAIMASRFLDSKSTVAEALEGMRSTLQFRKDVEIENLREAASDTSSDLHIPLRKFLASKTVYVSGFDKQGRSTYVFIPRRVQSHDDFTCRGHVWSLERALACSADKRQEVNAMVDCSGFSYRNAPPTAIGQEIMHTLRHHYVGHVNQIFILNAPVAFYCLWALFKPFAGRKTREKIRFVSSDAEKRRVIGEHYDTDQVARWMHPEGTKNRELDLEEYLERTSFEKAFDE